MYQEMNEKKEDIDKWFAENYSEEHRINNVDPHFKGFGDKEYMYRDFYMKEEEEKKRAYENIQAEYNENIEREEKFKEEQRKQQREQARQAEERNRLAKFTELNESISTKIKVLNADLKSSELCLQLEIGETEELIESSASDSELISPKSTFLCLLDESRTCLSSIKYIYIPDENIVSIHSHTREAARNKKYNLLLRAIIILSMETFVIDNPGLRIKSTSINPISLYTLIKHFHFRCSEDDPDKQEIESLEEITPALLQKYEIKSVYLEITDEALGNAREMITRLTGEIVSACKGTGKGGKVFRKKYSKTCKKTRKRKAKGKKTKKCKKQKSYYRR
jgi:ribonucleotide reductase alpha subunit